MSLRFLLLAGAGLLAASAPTARAAYQFTGSAYFPAGGSPQTNGSGQFTFQLAPVGSGVGLSAPADLPDGFETAQGYILRYITAQADVGQTVRVTWTADRDFLSVGSPSYTTIAVDLVATLISEGGGVTLDYFAGTEHRLMGPGSDVFVSGSLDLMPGNATATVSRSGSSAVFVPLTGVADSLRQTVQFDITPTEAGQEVRIHFSPRGVVSTGHNLPDVNAVPAPPALILCLSAVPVLGAMGWRSARRKTV